MMGNIAMKYYYYCSIVSSVMLLLLLWPAAVVVCYTQDTTFVSSRATYYGSPDCLGTPSGACGFGEYGRTVNGGEVSGVSRLYRNGTGCGACYQVRCKAAECSEEGVKIVVTDYGEGDNTDFIFSARAYTKLARPNTALKLFSYGVVEVEYRRVRCQYPGINLMVKVHQYSKYPDYLALFLLYQSGINDVTLVQLWQEDCHEWRGMRRAYGGVWDMANPPKGALSLRFQLSGPFGFMKWVQLRDAIPSDWKAGAAYDTSIQLS